ncbi:MAG: ribosomal protein S18-alanine N-acetyltransferase [Trichlorobacter sp.]|jgi:ribosomal-protein-alanine N-acetyltransferase
MPFLFTPYVLDDILHPMIRIRPMIEADLAAVLAIEQACFSRAWTREHFLAELGSERGRPAVAELSGRVAGYLCLTVLLDEAEVLNLAVDPALQRSGIGAALLGWACDEAARQGAGLLRLEVRTTSAPAIALYKRFGFVRSGLRKAYYELGVDALLMDKYLVEEDVDAV